MVLAMSDIGHSSWGGSGAGVVVAAASSGGLAAFRTLLAGLPAEFPWPILLVQHRSPQRSGRGTDR
jgi:chemotaxis response regulator CheB